VLTFRASSQALVFPLLYRGFCYRNVRQGPDTLEIRPCSSHGSSCPRLLFSGGAATLFSGRKPRSIVKTMKNVPMRLTTQKNIVPGIKTTAQ